MARGGPVLLYKRRRHPLARKNEHWRNEATICTHSSDYCKVLPRFQPVMESTLFCPFGTKMRQGSRTVEIQLLSMLKVWVCGS
jgi:hypothetical protein